MSKFNTLYEKIVKAMTLFGNEAYYTLPDELDDAKCRELVNFLENKKNTELAGIINKLEHVPLGDPQWKDFLTQLKTTAQAEGALKFFTDSDWALLGTRFINRIWGKRKEGADEQRRNINNPDEKDLADKDIPTNLQRYDKGHAGWEHDPNKQVSFLAAQMKQNTLAGPKPEKLRR